MRDSNDSALLESLAGVSSFLDLPTTLNLLNQSAPLRFTMVSSEDELLALDLLFLKSDWRAETGTSDSRPPIPSCMSVLSQITPNTRLGWF